MALTFGEYGGRYVPETLIPALDELERGWREAQDDPTFGAELHRLLTEYAGRPSPLTLAERFAPGTRLYLKREDLLHTGEHNLNNALGQAVLARRLGKQRIVAETGAGQHGVATATVCAHFGLSASSHGLGGHAPPAAQRRAHGPARRRGAAGRVRYEDAEGSDERVDPRLDRERGDDALPDRLLRRAAAPYPELVRELQAVIGRESREQILAAEGRLPEAVVACVGGGSNAIGMFAGFLDESEVRLVGVEAAGAASLGTGRPAVLHGARSRCSPTRTARSRTRTRSPPGSTIRASAPSMRSCATAGGPST